LTTNSFTGESWNTDGLTIPISVLNLVGFDPVMGEVMSQG
jgi:hypothetical protein